MCKTKTLFKKIVLVHMPEWSHLESLVDMHPNVINIEHLIELTMAKVGGYNFVDGDHHDFVDASGEMSECKTASVFPTSVSQAPWSYPLEITNVVSLSGQTKFGLIRIVLYNPHKNDVDYFCIPAEDIGSVCTVSYGRDGKGKIRATWYKWDDTIKKLEKYRVADFVTLSKLTKNNFKTYQDKFIRRPRKLDIDSTSENITYMDQRIAA